MGQNDSYNQSQGALVECMCVSASEKWSPLYASKSVSLLWGDNAGQMWSWGAFAWVEQQELELINSAASKHNIIDFLIAQNRPRIWH